VTAIRDAVPEDGAACAAVYRPYVTDTVITFEYEPPTAEEMAGRIARVRERHAWVVLEDTAQGTGARIVGYAYAAPVKDRAAYRWACEVSVYLELGRRRRGAGRALYEALFERLEARGYRRLIAGMTLPNEASEGLHLAMGFEPIGVQRRIGWKHDAWHDVSWVQRPLGGDGPPIELR
jgi:phosphinothricin acetyltransferase